MDILPEPIIFKNETDQVVYDYIKTNGFITAQQVLNITRIRTHQGANIALGRLMDADLI